MKTKVTSFLSLMLLTSLTFAAPGDVITEDATTDPGLPRAEVDGDLVIIDADNNNSAVPGLHVEGPTELMGGVTVEGVVSLENAASDETIALDAETGVISATSITLEGSTTITGANQLTTKAYVDEQLSNKVSLDTEGRLQLLSMSLGANTTASGVSSIASGFYSTASGDYSTASGFASIASGVGASASGITSRASGDYSTARGYSTASGGYSFANGYNSTASGFISTAIGYNSTAIGYNSTAIGGYSTASGGYSTAIGYQLTASGFSSAVFGRYNIGGFASIDGDVQWYGVDPLFEVGAGDSSARANALTLLKDGRIALGKHTAMTDLQARFETVQVEGAIKVGDYVTDPGTSASEGAIRFGDNGSGSNDLLAYVGGTWKSLTQSSGVQGDISMGAFTAQ